jgi:hypothetical protein
LNLSTKKFQGGHVKPALGDSLHLAGIPLRRPEPVLIALNKVNRNGIIPIQRLQGRHAMSTFIAGLHDLRILVDPEYGSVSKLVLLKRLHESFNDASVMPGVQGRGPLQELRRAHESGGEWLSSRNQSLREATLRRRAEERRASYE